MVQYVLPSGASIGRTLEVAEQVERHFLEKEAANTEAVFVVAGRNFSGTGQNAGMAVVALKNWSERKGLAARADTIAKRATAALASVRDAQVFTLNPPPVQGLGQSIGFEYQLQADPGTTRSQLKQLREQLLTAARADTKLSSVPQLTLTIFDNGKNSATLDAALAEKRGYVAAYELAIQVAFKEVADALARRGTLQAQLEAESALVGAASRGLNLAQARYSQGIDTFLNTLDAQRTLYSAQSALISLRRSALDNRVTLYRVLGGGLAGESAGEG